MKRQVYFPNLNGLRFIAVLLVIIHHIEQFKGLFHISDFFKPNTSIYLVGQLGVVLFFVLSGFLITYLLLVEEQSTGTISIRDFYIRRILRIWPLYFFIFPITLYLLPHLDIFTVPDFPKNIVQNHLVFKTLIHLFFIPTAMVFLSSLIPGANQLWSIGTEEQFYVFWPILIKQIKKKRFLLFVFIIVAYVAIRKLLYHVPDFYYKWKVIALWEHFNIDCMAIGATFSLIHFYDKKGILKILYNKVLQQVLVIALPLMVLANIKVSTFYYYDIYAVLFAILILNVATNPDNILRLENKVFNYLGKISYGLYMYHSIVIIFVINLSGIFHIKSNFFIYSLVLLLTVSVSSISYSLFEKKMMRLKVKFSSIISGDSVRNSTRAKKSLIEPILEN